MAACGCGLLAQYLSAERLKGVCGLRLVVKPWRLTAEKLRFLSNYVPTYSLRDAIVPDLKSFGMLTSARA